MARRRPRLGTRSAFSNGPPAEPPAMPPAELLAESPAGASLAEPAASESPLHSARPLARTRLHSRSGLRSRRRRARSRVLRSADARMGPVARLLARVAAFLGATVLAAVLVRFLAAVAAGLPVFLVDEVRVEGISYLSSAEVRSTAGVGPATSLWQPQSKWIESLEAHPLVESAEVERRPPSGLVFRIREVQPVALVASPLVHPVDVGGNRLPVDPSRPVLDLPLVRVVGSDSAVVSRGTGILARELRRMDEIVPEIFAVVSEAVLEDGLVTLLLGDSGPRVRYRPPLSEARLREGIIAMNDALERFPNRPPHEVDLRFQGQVVIRGARKEAEQL